MKKKSYLFIPLIFLFLLLNLLSRKILNTDDLLLNTLAGQLTDEQINELLNLRGKWDWINYFIYSISLLVKLILIAGILDAGCFFYEKEISFKKLFIIAVKAEFIFLFVIVFKTIWFYVFKQDYTLKDLHYFHPLSAINITGYNNLDPWFVYPLQAVNLFEITYWFLLAHLISKEIKGRLGNEISIVFSSYGICLLIWIISVMFFTLNIS